ncbi:TPA: DUF2971 domain-containing protein [Klebsiella aerogenes]|nr:DUF2971 domain-containing protein [Klebsiella aerogenes]
MSTAIPDHLYKYKSFNSDSLELIIADKLFFSHPSKFNDPLDCQTQVIDDIEDEEELKEILFKLHQNNAREKLLSAAKKLRYKGPKTLEKIEFLSTKEGIDAIADIYLGVNFHGDSFDIRKALTFAIGEVIRSGYNNGVLSLAEKNDCPLMWSHYADNHQGICLGYSIPEARKHLVNKINYDGETRTISTSQVRRMLNNDSAAKKEMDDAIFLRKASQWGYENEWRVISQVGLQDSYFVLTDITFGMRCKDTTRFTLMKALENREYPVHFYQMEEIENKFELKRTSISLQDEEVRFFPTCNKYETDLLLDGLDD